MFLVVGQTKNSADVIFNVLKTIYKTKDSHSIEEFFEKLTWRKILAAKMTSCYYLCFWLDLAVCPIVQVNSNVKQTKQLGDRIRESFMVSNELLAT